MKTTQISTPCGEILGIEKENCIEYRGIRYATAERWEYPRQVTSWDGVYDATHFGACSYQRRGFEDDAVCNPFYHKEFRDGMSFTYSEDCLFLNIQTPKNAENCPVLVYIHGGSFTGGSADEGHISGDPYTDRGIIFVGLNYRLGPYGFCSHPDLRDEKGICGNYGLYDQYTALKWIRENIKSFGGDGSRITLLGQSAGAMSVDIQLSNPMCEGWFSGAVLMSCAALQRGLIKPVTPEKSRKFWDTVIRDAGCKSMEELRKADEKALFYAWQKAQKEIKTGMLYTFPVYDGRLLTKERFTMKGLTEIPCIIGVTKMDLLPVILEILARRWVKNSKGRCYIYNFMRDLPGDDRSAWHSSDLLYAFSTLERNWRPFEDTDRRISKEVTESFSAFVKTGDPNCKLIPKWEVKTPMHFCEKTRSAPWNTRMLMHNTIFNKGPK